MDYLESEKFKRTVLVILAVILLVLLAPYFGWRLSSDEYPHNTKPVSASLPPAAEQRTKEEPETRRAPPPPTTYKEKEPVEDAAANGSKKAAGGNKLSDIEQLLK